MQHKHQETQLLNALVPSEAEILRATQRFLEGLQTSTNFSSTLRELRASGHLSLAVPEFVETWGPRGEQSPDWHPEGSVWTHTLMVVDSLPADASFALTVAATFHDIGKPATFFRYPNSGGITFAGHAQVGADLLRRLIGPRLGLDSATIEHAATIIEHHMFMHEIFKSDRVSPEFQQHILSLPCVKDLIELQHADVNGTGISTERKAASSFRERLYSLLAQS